MTISIYLAGDSTVQNYKADSPQGGWGEFLQSYVSGNVQVINRAIGAEVQKRSLKKEGLHRF
ncbi:hypothetical protein RSC3_01396 [Bacillus paralicheniformis]|nr:hypothetical protein RSC3_01396 [Bacillus paralicheniformis]